MRRTRTRLAGRCALGVLAAAVALLAFGQAALAATSFTVREVDKNGAVQQVGTWTYDPVAHTLTGAPFVQTLTSTDHLGATLPFVPFSGQDAFSSTTKMAVATKGFSIDDLAAWVAEQNDIPLGGSTEFNVTCTDTGGSFYFPSAWTLSAAVDRYWYPSYNYGATPSAAVWDDATRMPRKALLVIQGNSLRRSQTTPADPTDYATLLTALGAMAATVGDSNSLQLWMGQVKGGYEELNLGANAARYIDSLTFMPAYLPITTSAAGGGGTATVTIDDGCLKATAGEAVSFTIDDVTAGYTVGGVAVTDAAGAPVTLLETAGTYSFTMPASAATITVSLVSPTSIDLADASIAPIRARTYTGSVIEPPLVVTHDGATLAEGVDYTVEYAGNTMLGIATATLTGIGTCTGTNSATFVIVPAKAVLRTVKAGRGAATVSWKKNGGGVSGYEVSYRKKGAAAFKTAGRTTALSLAVRHLKRGSYTFRVRAYKVVTGTTYRGSWSISRAVSVK